MDEESDEKPCGYYYHSSFPLSENLKVFPPYNLISLLPVKNRGATEWNLKSMYNFQGVGHSLHSFIF